jgi:hypothetical protein
MLAAIMQDDVCASSRALQLAESGPAVALNPSLYPAQNLICRYRFPVAYDQVPLHGGKTERAGDAQHGGPPGTMWSAEERNRLAQDLFENVVACGELRPDGAAVMTG